MSAPSPSMADLDTLQRDTIGYFLRAANPDNGLISDSSREGAPCSIAATGLGLAAYVVAAERGILSRREAADRTLAALRFFRDSAQGQEPNATGYQGFYYHFLDMKTGRRVWDCELSMIDTPRPAHDCSPTAAIRSCSPTRDRGSATPPPKRRCQRRSSAPRGRNGAPGAYRARLIPSRCAIQDSPVGTARNTVNRSSQVDL